MTKSLHKLNFSLLVQSDAPAMPSQQDFKDGNHSQGSVVAILTPRGNNADNVCVSRVEFA